MPSVSVTVSTSPRYRLFSLNESKAWSEKFNLINAVFWIGWMAWIVISKDYVGASALKWFLYSVVAVVPNFVVPLLFPGKADKNTPLLERYWVKANLWQAIFGFVGNYFWTHYFYNLLGASYKIETYRINDVPIMMFLFTQVYFMFYHSVTNVLQRLFYQFWPKKSLMRTIVIVLGVCAFAYFTAFMEAFTLYYFPPYHIHDKYLMYVYGSAFYALYFVVSFPMFFRLEEQPGDRWTLSRVAIDAFAAAMIVTCLLDFWRLQVGSILTGSDNIKACLPFI